MIIDCSKLAVFDITEEVKRNNPFANKELKAYEFMSRDWYSYGAHYSFWESIQKCVENNLPNYSLWHFNQIILEDTKINRFKSVAKDYIRKGKRSGEYRGYVVMRENEFEFVAPHKHPTKGIGIKNNKKILRFLVALEYKRVGVFGNEVPQDSGYLLLLQKDIKEEKIISFLKKWESINSTSDKELLQINIDIYNFLIENKGILIEAYSDSTYYEYKGEAAGHILIDFYNKCYIDPDICRNGNAQGNP